MIERLVEHWLDSAGERTYQRCFCQMLTGQGYTIVHNTKHTPLEFGKDVIAVSPDGKLVGYQLKGNPGSTLMPRDFGEIRGQLEQLATLALALPGFRKKIPDECYLVTNGQIDEAVYHQIQLLNDSLEVRGLGRERIKTITRGTLLEWAKSLGMSLWPSELDDFSSFLRILNCGGNEMFPVQILDPLLQHTLRLDRRLKRDELRRRIASAAILTAVILHSFSRKRNHFAEITAWVMFASYVIAACAKSDLSFEANARKSIEVVKDAIYDLLGQICSELPRRTTLAQGDIFSEFAFYGPRAALIYMLMSVYWMWSEAEEWKNPEHKEIIERLLPNQPAPRSLWGEGAVPHIITFLWYRMKVDATSRQDWMVEAILRTILDNKLGNAEHLASPYYSIEDVARHSYHQILNCEDPLEGYTFAGESYFAESLLTFLVRANRKQACKNLWPDFSKLHHDSFIPDEPWQFCLYRTGEAGTNASRIYPSRFTWDELQAIAREHSGNGIPDAFKCDPILLLLFVNVFPHRASFNAMRWLQKQFDGTWFL